MNVRFQPVQLATNSDDTESQLVFVDEFLVAMLTHLSDTHGDEAGRWLSEIGFGKAESSHPRKFADLDEAQMWLASRFSPQ